MKNTIGVIVARMQVHILTEPHKNLIKHVIANNKAVIVFLGCAPTKLSLRNPLDFRTRANMIQGLFPEVHIIPLYDINNDHAWSEQVDNLIDKTFPKHNAILYGGRDSFIPHYKGVHKLEEFHQPGHEGISATKSRNEISKMVRDSEDFRAGVIYTNHNRYPISYQCVDVACVKTHHGIPSHILLAQKPHEDKWRFIGGFVDPTDDDLESAAKREFLEETGGNSEVHGIQYISSRRISDWRYTQEIDKVMTSFYWMTFMYGRLTPTDDISDLKWFSIDNVLKPNFINEFVIESHHELMEDFISKCRIELINAIDIAKR